MSGIRRKASVNKRDRQSIPRDRQEDRPLCRGRLKLCRERASGLVNLVR